MGRKILIGVFSILSFILISPSSAFAYDFVGNGWTQLGDDPAWVIAGDYLDITVNLQQNDLWIASCGTDTNWDHYGLLASTSTPQDFWNSFSWNFGGAIDFMDDIHNTNNNLPIDVLARITDLGFGNTHRVILDCRTTPAVATLNGEEVATSSSGDTTHGYLAVQDNQGSTVTVNFPTPTLTPAGQAENLVDNVVEYNFPTSVENAYLANLKKIEKFIEEGQVQAAINQLQAFMDKVEIDYAAGTITQSEYDNLINFAQTLLADLQ